MLRGVGRSAGIVGLALLMATSCGGDSDSDAAEETDTTDETTADDSTDPSAPVDGEGEDGSGGEGGDGGEPITGSGEIDPGLKPFIDDAVAQLSETLSISPTEITVESARVGFWGSSAIGCPEPRMSYAQVQTDGSAIELVVDGQTYWFHSGGTKTPFPCTGALRETLN